VNLATALTYFREAARKWAARSRAAQPRLTVTPAAEKPVVVLEIWGQYQCQKSSWVFSFALQSAVVALGFTAFTTTAVQKPIHSIVSLVQPDIAPARLKLVHLANGKAGGSGGGDRSPLRASKGGLPKAALRKFVPPQAVQANLTAAVTMEPTILAPPEVQLPQVNMSNYGDPFSKIGPMSNGPGTRGGIGSGDGGDVGDKHGNGYGDHDGNGIEGRIFRAGVGGVTAPFLIYKKEPEYSEEARKAKYQGTVTLYVEILPDGKAHNIRVLHSPGLGLDDKAVAAVSQWKFKAGTKDGKPVPVAASVEINFRLL
jgi:TonB family protein